MAVSSCNKEVATRLFRMLASDEQALTSVKHDHASYAKLSLLTQQAKLLKGQAVEIVNRAVAVQMENTGEAGEGQTCTAVSTEQNDGVGVIMGMLAVNNRTIATIRRDCSACAKLSLLADQVGLLQAQATQCMDEAELNRHLSEISARTTCRLVPGTVYYHYTQNGHDALSRIIERRYHRRVRGLLRLSRRRRGRRRWSGHWRGCRRGCGLLAPCELDFNTSSTFKFVQTIQISIPNI